MVNEKLKLYLVDCFFRATMRIKAHLVQGCLSFHISVLSFYNSNSKPITHNSNSTITQKIEHFCLVTKLSYVSQILTSLFAKMMDPPTDTTQKNMVAICVPFLFCSSNPTPPPPTATLHPLPSTKLHTTNGKSRNPQPPPPTALNTTTTSTKKSE